MPANLFYFDNDFVYVWRIDLSRMMDCNYTSNLLKYQVVLGSHLLGAYLIYKSDLRFSFGHLNCPNWEWANEHIKFWNFEALIWAESGAIQKMYTVNLSLYLVCKIRVDMGYFLAFQPEIIIFSKTLGKHLSSRVG